MAHASTKHRSAIVALARKEFFAHGFRTVTMDDLARDLGISKKTIYASFARKTDLLEALLTSKLDHVESDLQTITAGSMKDVPTTLGTLLSTIQHHMQEIQPPFLRDLQREAPELFQLVEKRRRKLIQLHFGKVISAGRRRGLLRKDLPTPVIIETLLGAVHAIMQPAKLLELNLPPHKAFRSIIDILLHGTLSEKGRARL